MSKEKFINYFGYGTNRDLDMMVSMIGRDNIEGSPGMLKGHELCIQKVNDIYGEIKEGAPSEISPRKIIEKAFGPTFELFVTRPNADGETYGTIWKITPEEYEYVRNWELLDFGMQEDIKAIATNEKEQIINVQTHGLLDPKGPINRVIKGGDYEDYLVPKKDILKIAEEEYASFKKSS